MSEKFYRMKIPERNYYLIMGALLLASGTLEASASKWGNKPVGLALHQRAVDYLKLYEALEELKRRRDE